MRSTISVCSKQHTAMQQQADGPFVGASQLLTFQVMLACQVEPMMVGGGACIYSEFGSCRS
jgi:hypothetical protein